MCIITVDWRKYQTLYLKNFIEKDIFLKTFHCFSTWNQNIVRKLHAAATGIKKRNTSEWFIAIAV